MRALAVGVGVFVCGCTHGPSPMAGEGSSSTAADPSAGVSPSEATAADESSDTSSALPQRPEGSGSLVIRGAHVLGVGVVDVVVRGGTIEQLGVASELALDGAEVIDESGRFVVPAFIDSHVHLSYAFDARMLAAGGIMAVVDLASPIDALGQSQAPLRWLAAGPMITAIDGYPTQTWGAGGYGLECDGVDEVRAAVDRLIDGGAGVIKVPVGAAPVLDDAELSAAIERAHERGRKVAVHALSDADARRAADAGADVLAHTPTEALTDATIAAWSSRAVISTLDAFGGQGATIDNLRRLEAAGATVLYGTDMGNTGIPAIDHNEIDALVAAGFTGEQILAAATSTPAAYWGFDGAGAVAVGARASFLVLDEDPRQMPQTLADPRAVYIDGDRQPPSLVGDGGIKG